MNDSISERLKFALNAADLLAETGLTVVPVEPTQSMCLAGSRKGNITMQSAEEIYTAMISAAALP